MDNSTFNLLRPMPVQKAPTGSNGEINQTVSESSRAGVFSQLLMIQTQLKQGQIAPGGAEALPLIGKHLPSAALVQLQQLDKEGLAALAEQISAHNPASMSGLPLALQRHTDLLPAAPMAPGISRLATAVDGGLAQKPAQPVLADADLARLAQTFGASAKVTEKVLQATDAGARNAALGPVRDEQVLALAREASAAQLVQAKTLRPQMAGAPAPRADVGAMLEQMNGQLRAQVDKAAGENPVPKGDRAITADSFLANRSLLKAGVPEGGSIRSSQFDALLNAGRGNTPAPVGQASTSGFLEQRGLASRFAPVDEGAAAAGRFSSTAPVSLTTTDTAQHATEQLQRPAGSFRDNLLLPQNQERMQRAMGERIMQMVESGKWNAEMELNPARLGTVRIRLSMENNELQLGLLSQNAAVRDLLEASLPRLRDSLQDSGIALTQSSVGQEPGQQREGSQLAQNQEAGPGASDQASGRLDESNQETGRHSNSKHDGELDTFA